MSQTLSTILTTLAGQALSLGLAAFFGQYAWQYAQERLKKFDELERRLHRLECRDEMRKELGLDGKTNQSSLPPPPPPRPTPDKPQP